MTRSQTAQPDFDAIGRKYGAGDISPRLEKRSAPSLERADQGLPEPVRLENGHEWDTSTEPEGKGSLNVQNGNENDGVAIIYAKRENGEEHPSRAVYVRAGDHATVNGIAPGTYTLRFMLGIDWDDAARRFRRDLQCFAFSKTFEFREYDTAERDALVHHWTSQTVTLHKVIAGNANTNRVAPALLRFDELVRDR